MENTKNKKLFNFLAIILIAIFCISITPITLQNDTYYTIKIGEHILENGIDMKDPFSWHENLKYTYPHWLYDVIIYLVYALGGFTGIYISTCILSIILGISLYTTSKKLIKNQIISFVLTIGAMFILQGYIAARAQLVTFILFVLTIYFIEKFIETKQKRYAIGLIIIPILIANLHAAVWYFYFILYLPYIAEYLVAIWEDMLAKKAGVERKQNKKLIIERNENVKILILIMIACIFTGLITPVRFEPYTHLVKLMSGTTTQNINEHLPMTLINHTSILCTLIIVLAMLIFTDTKIRLQDLLMLGGLAFLMLYSRRQQTMFILVGSIILGRMLKQLTDKHLENFEEKATKSIITPFGIFMTTAVVMCLTLYCAKGKLDDKYVDKNSYPVEMCDYILENYSQEEISQMKIYNEYNYGSYMLYRGIPVFIDSRCDLYSPEFNEGVNIFDDFLNSSNLGTYFEKIFDKYDITHVILYKDSKINMIIENAKLDNYELIKSDDKFVFYKRTGKGN